MHEKYIFVYQDVRGRYMSEGTFENVRPFVADSIKARAGKRSTRHRTPTTRSTGS